MITEEKIYAEISRVLREEVLFTGTVDRQHSLRTAGLDSIQMMQLFVYLEEAFGFEFGAEVTVETVWDVPLDAFVRDVEAVAREAGR